MSEERKPKEIYVHGSVWHTNPNPLNLVPPPVMTKYLLAETVSSPSEIVQKFWDEVAELRMNKVGKRGKLMPIQEAEYEVLAKWQSNEMLLKDSS